MQEISVFFLIWKVDFGFMRRIYKDNYLIVYIKTYR